MEEKYYWCRSDKETGAIMIARVLGKKELGDYFHGSIDEILYLRKYAGRWKVGSSFSLANTSEFKELKEVVKFVFEEI